MTEAQRDFTFIAEPRWFALRFLLKQFGYVTRLGSSQLTDPHLDKKGRVFRVHASFGGRPICGGGRDASKATGWQTDIGPCSCRVCTRLMG